MILSNRTHMRNNKNNTRINGCVCAYVRARVFACFFPIGSNNPNHYFIVASIVTSQFRKCDISETIEKSLLILIGIEPITETSYIRMAILY